MDLKTWQAMTRKGIDEALTRSLSREVFGGWQENTITCEVLAAIHTTELITWSGNGVRAGYRVFKASGAHETANGDIAMCIEFESTAGNKAVATKYFEAKKRYLKSRSYDALDDDQLSRMQLKPGHEVLLYSFAEEFEGARTGQAWSLPTPLAMLLKEGGPGALHGGASSFWVALQLALYGRGLNWDPDAADAFAGAYSGFSTEPGFGIVARVGSPDFVNELDRSLGPEGYVPFSKSDWSEDDDTPKGPGSTNRFR